jgi:hypothetical protein
VSYTLLEKGIKKDKIQSRSGSVRNQQDSKGRYVGNRFIIVLFFPVGELKKSKTIIAVNVYTK